MNIHHKGVAIIAVLALLLCIIEASPSRAFGFGLRGNKNPRTIRAPYRNDEISTARGFGKRDTGARPKVHPGTNDINLSDNFPQERKFYVDARETAEKNDNIAEGRFSESVPIEWMTNELTTNPVLTRAILQRFVDTNRDGLLSARELMASPVESTETY